MKNTIEITQVIDSEYSILEEDGALVADLVVRALRAGEAIALSFRGVEMLTTPFIRALIAPLLQEFSSDINTQLSMTEIGAGDLARIKFVIDDMKLRLRNPESYDRARQHALESA